MLNWLVRYAPAVSAITELGGPENISILDVGCGPHGLTCAIPDAHFAGCEVDFPEQPSPNMTAVRTAAESLSFADQSFDLVICLDVLEHIPRSGRRAFVEELGRVAAGKVLLACPSDEGVWGDEYVRSQYELHGYEAPAWLSEHIEHGLPTVAELDAFTADVPGFAVRPWPMVNGWLASLVAFGDVLPELGVAAASEWATNRQSWLEIFQAAEFGEGPRKGFVLDRVKPTRARVPAGTPLEGVLGALPCGACGSPHRSAGTGRAVCTSCAREVAIDDHGVWPTP